MEKLTSLLVVAFDPGRAALAVDKAVIVAQAFGATVEVLVNDSAVMHAVTVHCTQRGYSSLTLHSVAALHEPEHETILRRVWSLQPDLVIKPPARDGGDWELANDCPAPVLLVRDKPWDLPVRLAAAVDVSDEDHASLARNILHVAGFLALGMHGHLDILYSEREAHDETVRMRRAVLLAQIVREFHVGCERLQIFSGDPELRLPPLVAVRQYDVLVLGSEGRGAPAARALPRDISRLLQATDSDVVLIKPPLASAAFRAGDSPREQRANQS